MLSNKKILLGITGGIAAYKTAFLIRELKKLGAEVKCIMTPASSDFITPLTVATLSQNPAYIHFWNKDNGVWNNHVDLGMWADLFVICPLTANTLAKLAHGYCDNLLTATYLSAKCPVFVAPAMDLDMYAHATTIQNLNAIENHGVQIIPAEEGFLASGLIGKGRMAEPTTILDTIIHHFQNKNSLQKEHILITAGPTYEAIDPVRFIGNHSSGKMGFALAEECLNLGAKVTLITGPTQCKLSHPNLQIIPIQSAQEMLSNSLTHFPKCTGGIFAAAVSDYRPKNSAQQKIKKDHKTMQIELVKNPDILKTIGEKKNADQWLVGFALETNNAIAYGKEKLKKKNLDFIVVNSLEDQGAGFGHNTNKITILDKNNNSRNFELATKKKVAINIIDYLIHIRNL